MGFTEDYATATDSVFIQRVTMAMLRVLKDVAGEVIGGMTAKQWEKRGLYAARALNQPRDYAPAMALAVMALGTVSAGSTDAALQAAVVSLIDDLAGVTGADLVP